MSQFEMDTSEYIKAANDYNDLVSPVSIRRLADLVTALGRPVTNPELAKLVVAAVNGDDLAAVLPLSEDAKTAFRFKQQRQAMHLTQQEVASKTNNYTQSQIAKAESGQLTLTPSRWHELFKVLGKNATMVIK